MIGQATCVNFSMCSNVHGFWLRLGLRSLRTKLSLQTRRKISKNFLTYRRMRWLAVCKTNSVTLQISGKGDAGQLEDQRQYDIQQLSQLVGIHEITTEDNSLTITTSSGALLVSKGQAFSLSSSVSGALPIFRTIRGMTSLPAWPA